MSIGGHGQPSSVRYPDSGRMGCFSRSIVHHSLVSSRFHLLPSSSIELFPRKDIVGSVVLRAQDP